MNGSVIIDNKLTKQESDLLLFLNRERFISQRILAERIGVSLGAVNKSLNELKESGYLDEDCQITNKARELIKRSKPQRAVIMATGMGMNTAPINLAKPKALLEIKGEVMIERQIKQLNEVGITEIYVVVGFLKESFEYLVDKYNIQLIINDCYSTTNNIYTIKLADDYLQNCYIVPSDMWCSINPFNEDELYSWYMVTDTLDRNSNVRINRKNQLVSVTSGEIGNRMIGIAYLLESDAVTVVNNLKKIWSAGGHSNCFWEDALFVEDRMLGYARAVTDNDIIEINTYEQLLEIDSDAGRLNKEAMDIICAVLDCEASDIRNISVLKKGMTNRSFLFSIKDSKYIIRIPGEGTDRLINRKQEVEVYKTINGLGICDNPIYIDGDNGYKITEYIESARVCDAVNETDVIRCVEKLKAFHNMHLKVDHEFDIFGQIEFYESLWNGSPSLFRDYQDTKDKILSLRDIINGIDRDWCLTHLDAVPDNFLFYKPGGSEEEGLMLTDWEYSGMQDPHVDIAMFCIYSNYNKEQCDHFIDIYFDGVCDIKTRGKIYCYIAACGLLWSNWCEYKRYLGVEFGEYNILQYRYAKDFFKCAMELL